MAKSPQQLARLAVALLALTRGRFSFGATLAICIGAVLYVAVLQPVAKQRFGIPLPSLPGLESEAPPNAPATPPVAGDRESPPAGVDIGPDNLPQVLKDRGRGVYESPAGVRYTRGSQHGHRLNHLLAHTRDEPDRPGQHGVFDETDPERLIRLIDNAYEQALSGADTKTETDGERRVHTVNLGRRIGYVGGQSGKRKGYPPARHIKLVMIENRLITAFPFRP